MARVVGTRRGFVLLGALGASTAGGIVAAACQGPGQQAAPAGTQRLTGTIRVVAFANAGQGYEFTQEAAQRFHQKGDVRVTVEGVTESAAGEYLQKLTTMLVADQPPDAFWNSSTNGLALSYGGHGEAIDSYFARDKMKWSDFFPLAKDCVQALGDNVSWALPVATLTYHFWYNRSAFRQAGVAFPDDNWTFEKEYFEAARRLTREGAFGTAVSLGAPIMVQYVYAFGGQVLTNDLKAVALNGPEAQRALQWHLDLSQRHQVAPGPDRVSANLVRREVAMGIVGAPIIVKDLRETLERVRPEFVCVATPASVRIELIEAAALGAHVYCDKPLGTNAGEATRCYDAVRRAGVKHAYAATHRVAAERLALPRRDGIAAGGRTLLL